jgi:hypothetical protein
MAGANICRSASEKPLLSARKVRGPLVEAIAVDQYLERADVVFGRNSLNTKNLPQGQVRRKSEH